MCKQQQKRYFINHFPTLLVVDKILYILTTTKKQNNIIYLYDLNDLKFIKRMTPPRCDFFDGLLFIKPIIFKIRVGQYMAIDKRRKKWNQIIIDPDTQQLNLRSQFWYN